jgi:hypothetical protein
VLQFEISCLFRALDRVENSRDLPDLDQSIPNNHSVHFFSTYGLPFPISQVGQLLTKPNCPGHNRRRKSNPRSAMERKYAWRSMA